MKINDKLEKVDNNFCINKYDNGYMVEISGRDEDDDYTNARILCNTLDEVIAIVREYDEMEPSR